METETGGDPFAPEVVVIGLGNRLRRDEGLGVCALERLLARYNIAPGVQLVDGGTLGLDLLAYVEGARKLLVLDATLTDDAPGALMRLVGEEVPAYFGMGGSSHEIGLPDLLAVTRLRGTAPEEVVALGLQPHTIELGWELSPVVASRIDELADAAARQLTAWGYPATLKAEVSAHA
ncbi:MAG TPA: HyaD/HybD family hydrogenase maturation endopeptidase [Ktedonobacterales bacterium]